MWEIPQEGQGRAAVQGVLRGMGCALGDRARQPRAFLPRGWGCPAMGRFCKFICLQLLASEPENLPRAAHPEKGPPAFQVKAAALSSGSHRCCPTLELTGGCSTLLTQMSMLSRAEHIPVHLQDSKSSQGSLQTATGYGAAEGREGVTPPACSPGCRAPS